MLQVIEYLAHQVQVAPATWATYDLDGRGAKYDRMKIRKFFGFREVAETDLADLTAWLLLHAGQFDNDINRLTAAHRHEAMFCTGVYTQLSNLTKSKLNGFLDPIRQPAQVHEGGAWREVIYKEDKQGVMRVYRLPYEMVVQQALRETLCCREVWVEGANKYRNPDEDLPADIDIRPDFYYGELGLPMDPTELIGPMRDKRSVAFCRLLNFGLMPRLKGIHLQKLYRPDRKSHYPNLKTVADTDSIIRRFTRKNTDSELHRAFPVCNSPVDKRLPIEEGGEAVFGAEMKGRHFQVQWS